MCKMNARGSSLNQASAPAGKSAKLLKTLNDLIFSQ